MVVGDVGVAAGQDNRREPIMKRLITAQLVNTILSHPQTAELVARAAREAVGAAAERLEHRSGRGVVQATIERDGEGGA